MTSTGDPKKEIIEFKNFMAPMDRTNSGAYLRAKWVTPSDTLTPVSDIEEITPATVAENQVMCFVNAGNLTYLLSEADTGSNGLLTKFTGATDAELVNSASLSNTGPQGAAYYPSQDYIAIIDRDGEYHTYDVAGATFNADVQTDGNLGDQAIIFSSIDNTIYWTTDNNIHKDFEGTITQNIFTLPEGIERNQLAVYGNYLVTLAWFNDENMVRALFWDRDTGNTLLDRNINISNGKLLASGVLNGRLTVVVAEENEDNRQSLFSYVAYQYNDGGAFRETSRINIKDATQLTDRAFYCDGNSIYVASPPKLTATATNSTGYEAGVYRVNKDGLFDMPITVSECGNTGYVHGIGKDPRTGNLYLAYENNSAVVSYAVTKTVERNDDDASLYATVSDFQTQMLGDGFTEKKLVAINLGFEELDATFDQTITVSYRLSTDDAWTEIESISHTSHGAIKSYQVSKINSTTPLPEYTEIEFRLTSANGAVILRAEYLYRFINRNPITG